MYHLRLLLPEDGLEFAIRLADSSQLLGDAVLRAVLVRGDGLGGRRRLTLAARTPGGLVGLNTAGVC